MKSVEFYFLLDNQTWTTDFIDIPDEVMNDEPLAVNYVYKNVDINKDTVLIGVFSWNDEGY